VKVKELIAILQEKNQDDYIHYLANQSYGKKEVKLIWKPIHRGYMFYHPEEKMTDTEEG
jgi:hypothetical protein